MGGLIHLPGSQPITGPVTGSLASFANESPIESLISRMAVKPTEARVTLMNNFINGLRADGLWPLIDAMWVFAAHDKQAACLNWKYPGDDFVASPAVTWTLDSGLASDASTTALVSPYNPSIGPRLFTETTGFLSFYSNETVTAVSTDYIRMNGETLPVPGPNLYAGGNFDSASDVSGLLDGSTLPGRFDWVAPGYLRLIRSTGNARADKQLSGLITGAAHRITVSVVSNPQGMGVTVGTAQGISDLLNGFINAGQTGVFTFDFTPTVANPFIRLATFTDGVTLVDSIAVSQLVANTVVASAGMNASGLFAGKMNYADASGRQVSATSALAPAMWTIRRNALNTQFSIVRNGTQDALHTVSSTGLPNGRLIVLSTRRISFIAIGGNSSAGLLGTLRTRLSTYMTALGTWVP